MTTDSINEKLDNIQKYLARIEDKMDNFIGFEEYSLEEKREIIEIKKEMENGKFHSYDEVFN